MTHSEQDTNTPLLDQPQSNALSLEPLDFPPSGTVQSNKLAHLDLPSSPSPFEEPAEFTDFTHHDLEELPQRNGQQHDEPEPVIQTTQSGFAKVTSFTPHTVSYLIAFKLVGDRATASEIAAKAGQLPTLLEAARTATHDALAAHSQMLSDGVHNGPITHLSHRTRLCRDLKRWDVESRVYLTLRHVVGMTPGMVSDHTGADEIAIRNVTSAWVPTDATEAVGILSDIDSWIGRQSTAPEPKGPEGPNLDHLGDPMGLPNM